jgi:hypothetical protein
MEHFIDIGEKGYRFAQCCGTCQHCNHYESMEWVESSCNAHNEKMLTNGLFGVCDLWEEINQNHETIT